MEYERIDKVQVGAISPGKLRMKLLGAPSYRKKEERSISSRASPSRLEDMDYAKSSLLAGDLNEEASSRGSKGTTLLESSAVEAVGHTQGNQHDSYHSEFEFKEKANTGRVITEYNSKSNTQQNSNFSTVHSSKCPEDINGYESGHENGSTSSFEFHRGERTLQHTMVGPFSRNVPSKWNDAEKWIISRQVTHLNTSKKMAAQNQGVRQMLSNGLRFAPASMIADQKHSFKQAIDTKKMDYADNISRIVAEKFSFAPHCLSSSGSASKTSTLSDQNSASDGCSSTPRLIKQQNYKESSAPENLTAQTKVIPTVQSVSMRDVGTEMTPIASQEPSQTATPAGATTPIRSPISSIPTTPKKGTCSPSSDKETATDETGSRKRVERTELSERDQLRKEIVALGIQLGKMNIASWASKQQLEHDSPSPKTTAAEQLVKMEFEARAAAWEEAEKSKHTARFKREEVKIQAWESHQKAKFEAKMRKVEAQVEQRKARARERMVEKLAVIQQQVEEKQATARARMNRHAARTAQQVEQIRRSNRAPSAHFRCCSWFL